MKPNVPELLEKLITHGSLDQIAQELENQEIKGYCGNPGYCIIAEYLKAHGVENPGVYPGDDDDAIVYYGSRNPSISAIDESSLKLPSILNELAIRFDERRYPSLIAEGSR